MAVVGFTILPALTRVKQKDHKLSYIGRSCLEKQKHKIINQRKNIMGQALFTSLSDLTWGALFISSQISELFKLYHTFIYQKYTFKHFS